MFPKMQFRSLVLLAVLVGSLAFTIPASAGSMPCGSNYTVIKGDTLRKIATRCGTTVFALMLANPQISNANVIYPGQVFVLPGALIKDANGNDIYIVARGDTLKELAARFNTTISKLLALNPAITNANLIYEGQRLMIASVVAPPPTSGHTYIIQPGDTLRKIADRVGSTVNALLQVNPQITNANLIYAGRRLALPIGVTSYIVQPGDTLKKIATMFGTTVESLLKLNPQITNPNLIYSYQLLKIW